MRGPVDQAVIDAMNGYLRTCSSGGMPQEQIDLVRTHFEAAADLSYFTVVLFEAGLLKTKAKLEEGSDQ